MSYRVSTAHVICTLCHLILPGNFTRQFYQTIYTKLQNHDKNQFIILKVRKYFVKFIWKLLRFFLIRQLQIRKNRHAFLPIRLYLLMFQKYMQTRCYRPDKIIASRIDGDF